MLTTRTIIGFAALVFSGLLHACPEEFDRDLRLLRSKDTVNLCSLTRNKVVLVVNTASQCGYTPQFKGLEALHKRYEGQGLVVVGFPSDDFRQEYDKEADTARVCYVNYGVTFTMLATTSVKGESADPVFAYLAEQAGAPRWNFHKYLLGKDGDVLAHFPSSKQPSDIAAQIEIALAESI